MKWTLAETPLSDADRAELELLRTNWSELDGHFDVEILKHNRLRTVARVRGRERTWIVKRYERLGFLQRLRGRVLGAHAEREFRALRRLADRGLDVPVVFAFAERREAGLPVQGGLIMSEVPDALPLSTHATRPRLFRMGRIIRGLHDHGVDHPDLHGANFLLSHDTLFLIDFHSCRFPGRVARRSRRRALAKVYHSFAPHVPAFELMWFLASYLATGDEIERLRVAAKSGDPLTEKIISPATWRALVALERGLRQRSSRMERRRLRSRTSRCLVDSTSFAIESRAGHHVRRSRAMPLDAALAAVGPVPRGEVVKARGDAWVARVDARGIAERAVYVKHRRYSALERLLGLFRGHRLLAAWIVGHGMRVRGLPAPAGLALVERRRLGMVEAAWLIQEAIPGEPLDGHLRVALDGAAGDVARERQSLARDAGELARRLHDAGLRIHDLSPQNIVVASAPIEALAGESDELAHHRRKLEGVRLWFVDLDHVRFSTAVPDATRLRNLVQLGNLPEGHVTASDLCRALRAYDRDERRWFSRAIAGELREALLDEALRTINRMTRDEFLSSRGRTCRA